ncbi:MAG: RagB/SusD family nutrient uptake outer membrane protein [Prolixibacteraceae bacterium]|nr:RagB/SusD family nutrient uptake outer membrane protein [Prolixibacteraceae bacterium]
MRKSIKNIIDSSLNGRFSLSKWLLLCFLLTGCNWLFKPDEISISEIESYDHLVDAAGGVYGQFSTAVNSENFLFLNGNADDLLLRGNSFYKTYYRGPGINSCVVGANPKLDENFVYVSLFGVIASINNILTQYDIDNVDNKAIKEILGELFFIRAYCYFRLTRSYGQIPLINDTDVNYTVKKSSFEEIYEFIEYDLLKAIQFLPENNINSRILYQTPHRGVAKAVLAEVYLNWAGFPVKDQSKYLQAKTTAAEVIDSADFYGFSLLPDFADLWNKTGRYNQESTLCVYVKNSSLYYGYGYLKLTSKNIFVGYDFTVDNKFLFNYLIPATEVKFYNEFPKDYRRDITFFNTIYVPPPSIFEYLPHEVDTGYIYINQLDPCARVCFRKFFLDTTLIPPNQFQEDTLFERSFNEYQISGSPRIMLFRYAQTLLTYAEAAARSGSLDEKAYKYLNMIRRRANRVDLYSPSRFDIQTGLSNEAFADSVVKERGWELAGEIEGRWFDLLRLERSNEINNGDGYYEDNYYFRNKNKYLIPIPQSDMLLNSNLNN